MTEQPWKAEKMTKADWVAREVARSVSAGKKWKLDTVDFADPNRPLTCLEVDFPIVPINEISRLEAASGAAKKPIYQMSKWWARRQSSIFRSLLIAAATKAPGDPAEAAKTVWNAYYGNHQAKGAFKHLNVADIFMGGGTTIVEGSRLGMQMFGNDLNPVAWFVVKNEITQTDRNEVETLLKEIEQEVKPQIMPFYTCDCPRGHKGKWTHLADGKVMGEDFDATALPPDERKGYRYDGPEIVYVFWAKHGPCRVTGCGHRTPIISSPVMAVKTLTVKSWKRRCMHCNGEYDLEERDARMAPGVPLVIAETEPPFVVSTFDKDGQIEPVSCPLCGKTTGSKQLPTALGKTTNKKIELSLLVHPDWLRGEHPYDEQSHPFGGSADDDVEATIRWNTARAAMCRLIEVRGKMPSEIICPETKIAVKTGNDGGTVPGKGRFACGACGAENDVLESVKASGKTGPIAAYAIQGYCPECDKQKHANNGRFFAPASVSNIINAACVEWGRRRNCDLSNFWPRIELSYGWKTHGWSIPEHGFTHYWKMFNSRQLLVHSIMLKTIINARSAYSKEFVLGAFQQYLRLNNMFSIWHKKNNQISAFLSNNNIHSKSTNLESSVFCSVGDGSWRSATNSLIPALEWMESPTELVVNNRLVASCTGLRGFTSGQSEKMSCGDRVESITSISCGSSTALTSIDANSYDMVITDPPFGGIMQYAELSDFFYVWIRLALKDKYPSLFSMEYTPKALEAVSNPLRNTEPDIFYQKILTDCWREAYRILKSGGLLAFTFHHSEDEAWVAVLESLFDAGFYLQATYPIRSDETKGENAEFGSQKIEYDIIHVCRKRIDAPTPISWASLRRQILADVRDLQTLLEHHSQQGLPPADLQVIRRGKALEYFSRHYGKVFKDVDSPMSVLEALVGVNQLLEEESTIGVELPPSHAEPYTRTLLRLFDKTTAIPRDQMQKFLRGTGCGPSDFTAREWVTEQNKVFTLIPPLVMARNWYGRQRRKMTSDYEQAMFFIGACHEGSGINALDTLKNARFTLHPALGTLLKWFSDHGGDKDTREAAKLAAQLLHSWESSREHKEKERQGKLFDLDREGS